ncbi:MAG: xanthine dehydrogenase accessory protein XdhC [Sulfitobacter sp.]
MTEVFVQIIDTKGSAPRDAGTAMKVTMEATEGTIGGGTLEYRAIAFARDLIANDAADTIRTYALGPNLGQCCGGSVKLRFTREICATDATVFDGHLTTDHRVHAEYLWLWGAGHVGRAVVQAAPPQAFKITWIDTALNRFPDQIPAHVTAIPAVEMTLLAHRAPTDAHHLIFTYSHDIDLALCAALLKRGAASIGLIGSDTKWTRFTKRLREMGCDPSPITCPIGDKSLGKHPQKIASGAIAELLHMTQQKASA